MDVAATNPKMMATRTINSVINPLKRPRIVTRAIIANKEISM